MVSTIDLASCLADIPDRRRAEGKMYGQVGVILFSIIAMLSGARSYRQIHTLIDRRLAILNAAFPQAALRRSPAYTSVRGILQRLDPAELERAFRRHAEGLDQSCAAAPSRFIAIDGKTLRQSFDAFADRKAAHVDVASRCVRLQSVTKGSVVSKEPKVSKEERESQTERLYAKVGKIAVLGEHLNFALFECSHKVLEVKGLPQNYAQTVLIGQDLERMRRTWESLMKVHYTGDAEAIGMIDHISNRLDDIIRRRNDTVHRLWFIGHGDEETKSYEVAGSIKGTPDIGKKGRGGVKYTDK